jgi:hypothetical protein
MAEMNEALSNSGPINQAALKWLREAKASSYENVSYLVQLAQWGLKKGGLAIRRPAAPSQPEHHEVENVLEALAGRDPAAATEWLLSNPNVDDQEEQEANFLWQLQEAKSPQEAAQAVVETVYDLLVAESATFQE